MPANKERTRGAGSGKKGRKRRNDKLSLSQVAKKMGLGEDQKNLLKFVTEIRDQLDLPDALYLCQSVQWDAAQIQEKLFDANFEMKWQSHKSKYAKQKQHDEDSKDEDPSTRPNKKKRRPSKKTKKAEQPSEPPRVSRVSSNSSPPNRSAGRRSEPSTDKENYTPSNELNGARTARRGPLPQSSGKGRGKMRAADKPFRNRVIPPRHANGAPLGKHEVRPSSNKSRPSSMSGRRSNSGSVSGSVSVNGRPPSAKNAPSDRSGSGASGPLASAASGNINVNGVSGRGRAYDPRLARKARGRGIESEFVGRNHLPQSGPNLAPRHYRYDPSRKYRPFAENNGVPSPRGRSRGGLLGKGRGRGTGRAGRGRGSRYYPANRLPSPGQRVWSGEAMPPTSAPMTTRVALTTRSRGLVPPKKKATPPVYPIEQRVSSNGQSRARKPPQRAKQTSPKNDHSLKHRQMSHQRREPQPRVQEALQTQQPEVVFDKPETVKSQVASGREPPLATQRQVSATRRPVELESQVAMQSPIDHQTLMPQLPTQQLAQETPRQVPSAALPQTSSAPTVAAMDEMIKTPPHMKRHKPMSPGSSDEDEEESSVVLNDEALEVQQMREAQEMLDRDTALGFASQRYDERMNEQMMLQADIRVMQQLEQMSPMDSMDQPVGSERAMSYSVPREELTDRGTQMEPRFENRSVPQENGHWEQANPYQSYYQESRNGYEQGTNARQEYGFAEEAEERVEPRAVREVEISMEKEEEEAEEEEQSGDYSTRNTRVSDKIGMPRAYAQELKRSFEMQVGPPESEGNSSDPSEKNRGVGGVVTLPDVFRGDISEDFRFISDANPEVTSGDGPSTGSLVPRTVDQYTNTEIAFSPGPDTETHPRRSQTFDQTIVGSISLPFVANFPTAKQQHAPMSTQEAASLVQFTPQGTPAFSHVSSGGQNPFPSQQRHKAKKPPIPLKPSSYRSNSPLLTQAPSRNAGMRKPMSMQLPRAKAKCTMNPEVAPFVPGPSAGPQGVETAQPPQIPNQQSHPATHQSSHQAIVPSFQNTVIQQMPTTSALYRTTSGSSLLNPPSLLTRQGSQSSHMSLGSATTPAHNAMGATPFWGRTGSLGNAPLQTTTASLPAVSQNTQGWNLSSFGTQPLQQPVSNYLGTTAAAGKFAAMNQMPTMGTMLRNQRPSAVLATSSAAYGPSLLPNTSYDYSTTY